MPNDFTQNPPHPIDAVVTTFICPADYRVVQPQLARKQVRAAFTSYLGVSGTTSASKLGVLFVNSAIRPADITDGLSNTLAAGERPPSSDFWYGWWYAGYGVSGTGSADMILGVRDRVPTTDPAIGDCPANPMPFAPGSLDKLCDAFHFWSLHPGGTHFLFADGSVHFLRYDAAPILPALATRAGGETTPEWE
jgi:prepilin-type processing-associated H-X9-DG protein